MRYEPIDPISFLYQPERGPKREHQNIVTLQTVSHYCCDPKFWDTRLKSLNVFLLLSPPSLLLYFL